MNITTVTTADRSLLEGSARRSLSQTTRCSASPSSTHAAFTSSTRSSASSLAPTATHVLGSFCLRGPVCHPSPRSDPPPICPVRTATALATTSLEVARSYEAALRERGWTVLWSGEDGVERMLSATREMMDVRSGWWLLRPTSTTTAWLKPT